MVQSLSVSDNRFYATGKRKSSIARVWLKVGSGTILVNGKKYREYFKRPVLQLSIEKPFDIINKNNGYDVNCTVKGGGLTGQAGAVSLGISKALFASDGTLRKALKKEKLLTRDSRKVERKKYGQKKARRRFQFSKR
ncbi:MAG: 30S ribosomal protein S9 [Candidatus Fonsibacter sp.]|nr:30S ribosomal protein S9 [Candidatus Fonsibacter sp.]